MAQTTTDNKTENETIVENSNPENGVSEKEEITQRSTLGKVFESPVFSLAMKVAEKYAYSKSKIYRVLQHAFEKLKIESNRHRIEKDFKEKTSVLMRMVRAYYHGHYKKIPLSAVMRILGGLIYFVWVLDFIPDFIPLLGLADDLAVLVWVYNGLNDEIEDFERWESATAVNID